MKRLTIRNSDGSVSQPTDLIWAEALERLAAYEDTGMEPEEIEKANNVMVSAFNLAVNSGTEMLVGRLKEIIRAEAEGRLLILPCKVGDTVYCLRCSRMRLDEGDINEILVSKIHGVRLWVKFKNNGVQQLYTMQEIGQLVFLTREEAEAALSGGSDG